MRVKLSIFSTLLFVGVAHAASLTININEATGTGAGKLLGTIEITETQNGLLFSPHLEGLISGVHDFHIHEHPTCMPKTKGGINVPGLAAGGHFDPQGTNKHLGPYNDNGHLGDLPGLVVSAEGTATYPLFAPHIKNLAAIKNRSLIIHMKGDSSSDNPHALDGEGSRVACGIIQ